MDKSKLKSKVRSKEIIPVSPKISNNSFKKKSITKKYKNRKHPIVLLESKKGEIEIEVPEKDSFTNEVAYLLENHENSLTVSAAQIISTNAIREIPSENIPEQMLPFFLTKNNEDTIVDEKTLTSKESGLFHFINSDTNLTIKLNSDLSIKHECKENDERGDITGSEANLELYSKENEFSPTNDSPDDNLQEIQLKLQNESMNDLTQDTNEKLSLAQNEVEFPLTPNEIEASQTLNEDELISTINSDNNLSKMQLKSIFKNSNDITQTPNDDRDRLVSNEKEFLQIKNKREKVPFTLNEKGLSEATNEKEKELPLASNEKEFLQIKNKREKVPFALIEKELSETTNEKELSQHSNDKVLLLAPIGLHLFSTIDSDDSNPLAKIKSNLSINNEETNLTYILKERDFLSTSNSDTHLPKELSLKKVKSNLCINNEKETNFSLLTSNEKEFPTTKSSDELIITKKIMPNLYINNERKEATLKWVLKNTNFPTIITSEDNLSKSNLSTKVSSLTWTSKESSVIAMVANVSSTPLINITRTQSLLVEFTNHDNAHQGSSSFIPSNIPSRASSVSSIESNILESLALKSSLKDASTSPKISPLNTPITTVSRHSQTRKKRNLATKEKVFKNQSTNPSTTSLPSKVHSEISQHSRKLSIKRSFSSDDKISNKKHNDKILGSKKLKEKTIVIKIIPKSSKSSMDSRIVISQPNLNENRENHKKKVEKKESYQTFITPYVSESTKFKLSSSNNKKKKEERTTPSEQALIDLDVPTDLNRRRKINSEKKNNTTTRRSGGSSPNPRNSQSALGKKVGTKKKNLFVWEGVNVNKQYKKKEYEPLLEKSMAKFDEFSYPGMYSRKEKVKVDGEKENVDKRETDRFRKLEKQADGQRHRFAKERRQTDPGNKMSTGRHGKRDSSERVDKKKKRVVNSKRSNNEFCFEKKFKRTLEELSRPKFSYDPQSQMKVLPTQSSLQTESTVRNNLMSPTQNSSSVKTKSKVPISKDKSQVWI